MDQNNLNENNVSSGYDRGNYLGSVKRQFGWIGLSYTVFFLVYNLTMGIMSYLYQTIFPGGVDGLLSLPSSFKNLVYYAMMFIPAYLIGVSLLYAMLNRIKSNVPGRATMTGSVLRFATASIPSARFGESLEDFKKMFDEEISYMGFSKKNRYSNRIGLPKEEATDDQAEIWFESGIDPSFIRMVQYK